MRLTVLGAGPAYTDREFIKLCQEKLENFMVPKFVDFVPDLPKTDTGKITKKGLKS